MKHIVFTLGMAFLSNPAFAGFAAIAVNADSGTYGYSLSNYTQTVANSTALDNCYAKGFGICEVAVSFSFECAALAVADGGGWGAAKAAKRSEAEAKALQQCEDEWFVCEILVARCSN